MPLYFFDTLDGAVKTEDDTGTELESDQDAIRAAEHSIPDLLNDRGSAGGKLVVLVRTPHRIVGRVHLEMTTVID